jgi:hypothetical protein
MGWAEHETCMGRKEVYTGFWWGKMRKRESLEDPGVDTFFINMERQEIGWVCLKWTDLAQNKDGWRALVNAVIKLWVSYNAGNFLTR